MQSFSRGRNKLKDNNQQITYEGEVIATILKEIEYILCSLHDMGSYYADKEREEYERETTKFIDDSFVCNRLATIRMILSESFDLSIGEDDYNSHWKQYTFELKKAGFLNSFMKWKNEDTVPEDIEKFIEKINLLLQHEVSELSIIICHYAEKGTTTDEVIATTQDKIIHYLFKMSMCSFDCPNNLIINI